MPEDTDAVRAALSRLQHDGPAQWYAAITRYDALLAIVRDVARYGGCHCGVARGERHEEYCVVHRARRLIG